MRPRVTAIELAIGRALDGRRGAQALGGTGVDRMTPAITAIPDLLARYLVNHLDEKRMTPLGLEAKGVLNKRGLGPATGTILRGMGREAVDSFRRR